MILIRLKGGLGNQMFQYAFAMQIAKKLGTEMMLDTTSLLNRNRGDDFVYRDFDLSIFNIKAKHKISHNVVKRVSDWKVGRLTAFIGKRVGKKLEYIKEPHFHVYEPYLTDPKDDALYEGWFQSHRYFDQVETQLRSEFTFINAIIPNSRELANEIKVKNSICLNVRRTDFLQVDALNTTNLDYFLSAAQMMENKVENPNFYIFSDDVEWCKENIKVNAPVTIVDHSHKGTQVWKLSPPYESLQALYNSK